jgi:glycerophosphoryl diester phosphodiesterase
LVRTAHAQGRQIRFWGLQDEPGVWQELWDAGVDLINTDRLADLNRFLSARTAANGPER